MHTPFAFGGRPRCVAVTTCLQEEGHGEECTQTEICCEPVIVEKENWYNEQHLCFLKRKHASTPIVRVLVIISKMRVASIGTDLWHDGATHIARLYLIGRLSPWQRAARRAAGSCGHCAQANCSVDREGMFGGRDPR